ncbi:uncharacterized protein LY89DRAFT_784269 [Mollisia scopiformis]|uniref:Uncharacterized protein n=1 Tax=Mollisia scopiformis TaxID=149040 RepID=A0A194X274_MOLSC|nr:uncharacterized protein LY89DRAFT_784269 [Mollisia scopiformis]KUJ14301.1 hypothetical protein LY89DRAFT_784269 [Mollisia scopiformis]
MPAFNASNSINNEDRLGELYLKAFLAYEGLPIAQSAWISGVQDQQVAVLPIAPEDPSLQFATFQASTTAYSSTLNCTTLNATRLAYIDSSKEQQLAQDNSMPNKTRIDYCQLQYPISALFSGLGTHGGCQFTIEVPLGIGSDPTTAHVDEWYYGGMDFLSASETPPNSSIDRSCNQWFYLNVNFATLVYYPSNSSNFDFEATFGEEPTFNAVYCQALYLEVPNLKVDFLNTTTSPSFTYDPESFKTLSKAMSPEAFNSTQFEEYLFLDQESLKDPFTFPNTLTDGRPSTIQRGYRILEKQTVNQFAWTIVPVLAVILIKFFWALVDEYFRLLQPYISLAGGSASARSSICVDYVSTIEGWIIIKSILRRHYILAAVATLSVANEVLVTAMGALFSSRPSNVIKPLTGFTNSTLWTTADMMNFTDSSQVIHVLESIVPVYDIPNNTTNWFYPSALTLAMVAWDAQPAPWTTAEYAFLPVILYAAANGNLSYPESTNWTVSTTGVRGSANREALETPKNFFQRLPVVNNDNVTVAVGWEIHDWQDGAETTENTVTFQGSAFRVPSSRTGVRARQDPFKGSLQGVMNYTGFWGPLWLANISTAGDIELANISYPNSSISAVGTNNQTRAIWNLPEMKPGYFGAGFIDFSRVQEPETGIWYSTSPVASLVVCQPRFEYVNAQLILDVTSQQILEYEVNGDPTTLKDSQFFQTWHATDDSTPAEMGIGSAFTTASVFETGTMFEPGNLKIATETAFTSLFSQFAASPRYIFVPVDSSTPVTAGLVTTQMRIMISTAAMAIVVSILSVIIVVLATLSYWTKGFWGLLVIIDKEPDTIGSAIALVCSSRNLLQLLRTTEGNTNGERERILEQQKRRFRIEKFAGERELAHPRIEVNDGTR